MMAMVPCPACGKMISDRAEKCVHCGYTPPETREKRCAECGAHLEENADICQVCGCPVEENIAEVPEKLEKTQIAEEKQAGEETAEALKEAAPQQQAAPQEDAPAWVTSTPVSAGEKPERRKLLMMAAVAVVIVLGIFWWFRAYSNEKAVEAYGEDLEYAMYIMFSGASDAYDCGVIIQAVWYNAALQLQDPATDPYVYPGGRYAGDFNSALMNLFDDDAFVVMEMAVVENQEEVQQLMKELREEVPKQHKDFYEEVLRLYDVYLDLTNLATNPSGTYQSFSSTLNQCNQELIKCYQTLSVYMMD